MWVAFALTFFSAKKNNKKQKTKQHIWVSLDVNFNKSLTNDIVSFEQLGPEECVCWGFTAQSTQWGHVERGQFT